MVVIVNTVVIPARDKDDRVLRLQELHDSILRAYFGYKRVKVLNMSFSIRDSNKNGALLKSAI